jgi:two-component sensor histidine kinase
MAGTIERRDADMAHEACMREASLAEKEILLQEVHHRVKNNLRLILSLLSLQENEAISPSEFKEAMENRIKAMSTVYEMLYESDNFANIDLGLYAKRLVELGTCTADYALEVSVAADEALCSLDTAVPFGLMLNELVTNACKHAFGGRRGGSLHVRLRITECNARLEVLDDGPGLPAGFSISESSSLGLRLAHSLAQQLHGALAWDEGPGTRFIATFRIDASREA